MKKLGRGIKYENISKILELMRWWRGFVLAQVFHHISLNTQLTVATANSEIETW